MPYKRPSVLYEFEYDKSNLVQIRELDAFTKDYVRKFVFVKYLY